MRVQVVASFSMLRHTYIPSSPRRDPTTDRQCALLQNIFHRRGLANEFRVQRV
jgi:hypothetical protein